MAYGVYCCCCCILFLKATVYNKTASFSIEFCCRDKSVYRRDIPSGLRGKLSLAYPLKVFKFVFVCEYFSVIFIPFTLVSSRLLLFFFTPSTSGRIIFFVFWRLEEGAGKKDFLLHVCFEIWYLICLLVLCSFYVRLNKNDLALAFSKLYSRSTYHISV